MKVKLNISASISASKKNSPTSERTNCTDLNINEKKKTLIEAFMKAFFKNI